MAKKSIKSIIEEGIQGGKSVKMILSRVKKLRPDAEKTDEASVRYYANAAVRNGDLDVETAAKKYGCGARGRRSTSTSTSTAKTTKTEAKKPVAKKSAASKKSAPAKSKKVSTKRKSTSKA